MRPRSRVLLAVTTVTFFLIAGITVVSRTIEDLAPAPSTASTATSILRLGLLSLACAALATALIEFAKRLTPLRTWYNRRGVERWLFSDRAMEPFVIPDFAPNEVRRETGRDWRNVVPPEYLRRSTYFGGRIEEVTARLAAVFDQAVMALSSHGVLSETGPMELRAAFEQDLDNFQARTAAQWVTLLRAVAALVAASIAAVAAATTDRRGSVVAGTFFFGMTVGGPISWTLRDLVRVIEGRARY